MVTRTGNIYTITENYGFGVSTRTLGENDYITCEIVDVSLGSFTVNPYPHKPEARKRLTINTNAELLARLGAIRTGDKIDFDMEYRNGEPSKYRILGKHE